MATDMAEGGKGKALFTQVHFHIVQSKDFEPDEIEKLTNLLVANGAKVVSPGASEKIRSDEVTHIIATTNDFPDYDTANDSLKAVVKPDWVTASINKGRLANPRQYSPDPRMFFSGLIVSCADLPSGDKDAIIGGVLAMGGLYSCPITKQVTHIVALTVDADPCQAALSKNLKCKIVLPHWFDDCLKLGKRIDEEPYCLPDPEILRKRPEGRIPEASRNDLQGASTIQPALLPTPMSSPNANRRQLTIFKNKKIMLSFDLEIGSHLRGTIEDLINDGGGNVTGSVHKADIFICQYRESLDYRIASRAGKDVGNISWLYHLITHNSWTSPLRRLLHYPIARHGLPGFKNFRISLSNYNGEARIYLENVAKAAGGEFTKTMKEDNTHLITAHMISEKCDAAKEWNINMVNHLWLEESYAKWQIQTLANPKYTHFPTHTNLGEVVGQTPINREAVEKYFFPPGSDIDPSSESNQVPKPTPVKDKNISTSNMHSSSAPRSQDVPFRSLHSNGSTPKASKENRRHTDGASFRTPAISRFAMTGRESETPSTGSRSAKDKAVARLHNLAPDIALFDREMKRVGGVTHGGRKSSEDKAQNVSRKRSVSNEEDTDTGADEETRGAKRAKKAKGIGPPAMRLALTGYKKWIAKNSKEGEEKARLREMGILVLKDGSTCTHLASPRLVRTQKFVCTLAYAPTILSTDFVDQCLAENRRLNPEDYRLQDEEGEKRFGFKLTEAVARAQTNKNQLLQGYSIFCTETVHGGFDTFKAIVEVNGGKCMLYRGRAGSNGLRAASEDLDQSKLAASNDVFLVSGKTPGEARLWPKFRHMVEEVGKTPLVVNTDWMLNLALSQQKEYLALSQHKGFLDKYALADIHIEGDA